MNNRNLNTLALSDEVLSNDHDPDVAVLVIHKNPHLSSSIAACQRNGVCVTEISSLYEGRKLLQRVRPFDLVLVSMRLARFQSSSTSCIACALGDNNRVLFLNDADDDIGFNHIHRSHCVVGSPHLDGWKTIFRMVFRGVTPTTTAIGPDTALVLQAKPKTPFASIDLTPRQRQVLGLIRQGLSNRDIADRLNLTEGTVKLHNTGIFKSLGVRNRTEAAIQAEKWL